jgi:hypothetical protein
MPITILEVATARLGRPAYTEEDFAEAKVMMLGGCVDCEATIASYNAYPSHTGYWRCESCIDDLGFESVAKFEEWVFRQRNN